MNKLELKQMIKECIKESNVPAYGGSKVWMFKDTRDQIVNELDSVMSDDSTNVSMSVVDAINHAIEALNNAEIITHE